MTTMNTPKHTPGPLKAVQIIIENSPCTWAVQRKSIREQWGKPSIATYIDNEADARLFAVAPAMYEALQIMVKAANVDEIDPLVMFASIERAKDALAQAGR
jgi:spore coat polysaccharide biosynthesis protein SpsF (cytidylyltransferase family)